MLQSYIPTISTIRGVKTHMGSKSKQGWLIRLIIHAMWVIPYT
jgi:hypothetical protein